MRNPPEMQTLPAVAVFDFDGTLTRRDSLFPFLRMAVGPLRYWWGLVVLGPILMGYYLGLVPNWRAKEVVLTHFLAGLPEEQLQKLGQRFAIQKIPKLLRPEALQRLSWHQEQGHRSVLLSASLEAYLAPWAQTMGFNQVIGTQLAVQSGLITGRILGKNCYGREKVERLTTLLEDLSSYCLYAYGDSKGDQELLDCVHYPYYKTFQDAVISDAKRATTHWERGLILSIVLAAALYLGFVFWSGADKFLAALNLLPLWLIPALLALVFVGYCLRFLRWQWYLQKMGYQVPLGSSFQIFLASFALTASPGKAGESIKSLLLKRAHNIPVAATLAGLFCERFTDALSVVVLLICSSLFSVALGKAAIVGVGLVQLMIILILQQPKLIKTRVLKPFSRWPKLQGTVQKVENLIDSGGILLKPKFLVGGTLLAFIAWGLEGIALYAIFHYLGATSITVYQGVLIHTGAGLIGALSFLPGGIGGTEALMITMSMFYGANRTAAVTATLLIRLLTLWFAVVIGVVNLTIIMCSTSRK